MSRTDYNDFLAQDEARIAQRRAARAHSRRSRRVRATATFVALLTLVSTGFVAAGVLGTGRRAAASVQPIDAVAATGPSSEEASAVVPPQDAAPSTAESIPAAEPTPAAAASTPNVPAKSAAKAVIKKQASATQHLTVRIGDYGYEPSRLAASSASPISLTVGKGEGCAAGFVLPELGIELDNSQGPVTKSLGQLDPGTYRFNCAMGMVEGTLVVK